MQQLYCGMDLHSSNTYIGMLNKKIQRVFKRRVRNDLPLLLETLAPFKDKMVGIVVESTFNWYWLVDGLMDAGYKVHLANPGKMKQYQGVKYQGDKHDAFFLAKLLLLGILPEGFIYPKEKRPVRDMLRRRSLFVRHHTAHVLSVQSMIQRNTSKYYRGDQIKKMPESELTELLKYEYLVKMALSQINILKELETQMKTIEENVLEQTKLSKPFNRLISIKGVGKIIAMTIMLEVGDIGRFSKSQHFSSYARCVPSKKISNGKSKGEENRKNGNKYLSWAFSELVYHAKQHSESIQNYHNKKVSKTHIMIASRAIANKFTKAVYYMLRDDVPYKENKLFG